MCIVTRLKLLVAGLMMSSYLESRVVLGWRHRCGTLAWTEVAATTP